MVKSFSNHANQVKSRVEKLAAPLLRMAFLRAWSRRGWGWFAQEEHKTANHGSNFYESNYYVIFHLLALTSVPTSAKSYGGFAIAAFSSPLEVTAFSFSTLSCNSVALLHLLPL